jgi:DNA-binding response OmpR family regulator
MSGGAGELILVVDDDTDLLASVSDLLEFEGFNVATAPNGEEGLKKLGEIRPALIILDMNMPGMGGIPFLKEVSEMGVDVASIPILVFTARSNMEEFFDGVDVAGFMSKPCDPDDLIAEIEKILGENAKSGGAVASVGPRKILIADDSAVTGESLKRMLVAAGHEVSVVTDGAQVVERAIVEKPDMIAMRLVLKGMNGDAVASMLTTIPGTKNTPVVLFDDTGAKPRERGELGEAILLSRFVKSAEPAEIAGRIAAILNV